MNNIILMLRSLLMIALLPSIAFSSEPVKPAIQPIAATSHASVVPVIKGLSANPVLQIAVTIPSGNAAQTYRSVRCTINKAVLDLIEKIDLYLTGATPFSTSNLIGSMRPSLTSFDIPLEVKLKPGVHFIWFSVVLRNDASLDGRLELRCTELVDAAGKMIPVQQDSSDHAKRMGVAVRKAGEDKVHTYRIPGVATTDKGTLLSVYDVRYDRSGDLPGNIDVGLSRSTDDGKTWEPMKIIMDMGPPHQNNGIGDPAILVDPVTKKIWVAALWSKGNRSIAGSLPGLSPDTTGQFVVVSSEDDGLSWSAPLTITPQVKNPIWHLFFAGPGSGISMKDGKLVFAAQYWDEAKVPHSTIIYSDDHGKSWKGNLVGPKSNTTESQVIETVPGTLMLNMRDNRGKFRSVATTSNMGATWTEHGTSYNALRDPVCMGSLIKEKFSVGGVMKELVFFSNPNTSSGRYNMTIKASMDLGETWLPAHQLLIDERDCYGYSSLTKVDDNTIGILYEGMGDLYFVKIPVSEVLKK